MITIDMEGSKIEVTENGVTKEHRFESEEAFKIISDVWIRVGWDTKYVYSFSWMGRPVIQLPEDLIRIQEVIYQLKPDLIIETGVAHGGSLVFYANLCKSMNKGRVVGVDIEIRPHNRKAIEEHELYDYIDLVEGDSIDEKVIQSVQSFVKSGQKNLVILDSNHAKNHVLSELHAYSSFVSLGSYIVVCDGVMEQLVRAPRSNDDWAWNNPKAAAEEFLKNNKDFVIEEPERIFNEGTIKERVTYWPNAFLKRVR